MKELGEYLKEARESNGVGLEEAADDLNMTKNDIENLEEANIRAFKDVLSMKTKIKEYAKYLGLDPEQVVDEFNDFLFEHTSKISLDDILEAQKKQEEQEKKVMSPYTKPPKRPFYYDINIKTKPLLITLVVILIILIVLFLYVKSVEEKTPVIKSELLGALRSEIYEFAY